MSTNYFPFVTIPDELAAVFGTPDEGTRIYRREGPEEECPAWFDAVMEIAGPSVSPGGVSMYCPVSRAAVYKRVQEGKLTMLLFHVTHRKTTLFGKSKVVRESPYGLIPISEAKAWRKEIEERAVRQGFISEEELEGTRPDWEGKFLQWRENKRKEGRK